MTHMGFGEELKLEGETYPLKDVASILCRGMFILANEMENDDRALRLHLILEEVVELIDAMAVNDIVETADALADLDYVVQGTAIKFGVPQLKVFKEVHRSNMTKTPGNKRRPGKENDYSPPKIKRILERE